MPSRYRFQISARLLHWPRQCACCRGAADAEMRAAATRTRGKRVVHTTTRWWTIPYCSRCVGHIRKYRLVQNNVAAIEVDVDGYRVTVTIQRHDATAITEDEAERALTKAGPLILAFQTARFGGYLCKPARCLDKGPLC